MLEYINIKLFATMLLILFGVTYAPKINIKSSTTPVYVEKLASVDAKQIHCMAKNIFYEASGESIKGQAAVARVVLNRVAHGFAKTPCGVIYQATETENGKVCQFSWVCEGKGEPNKNSYRYKVAHQIAYETMVHDKYSDVIPKSVLFFHNITVNPLWPYAEVARIGNHIFYSKVKNNTVKPKKKISTDSET